MSTPEHTKGGTLHTEPFNPRGRHRTKEKQSAPRRQQGMKSDKTKRPGSAKEELGRVRRIPTRTRQPRLRRSLSSFEALGGSPCLNYGFSDEGLPPYSIQAQVQLRRLRRHTATPSHARRKSLHLIPGPVGHDLRLLVVVHAPDILSCLWEHCPFALRSGASQTHQKLPCVYGSV